MINRRVKIANDPTSKKEKKNKEKFHTKCDGGRVE